MWKIGSTVYEQVAHQGDVLAVPAGRRVSDKSLCYIVKTEMKSGKEYFINLDTRRKRWTLPPLPKQSVRPVRDRLIAFFDAYDPARIDNVDVILENYTNRVEALFQNLEQEYGPEPPYYPAPTARESTRKRILAFYAKYNPTKTSTVDTIVETFEGREGELFRQLVSKYGAEPLPDDAETDPEIEARVTAFYTKYRPNRLSQVPSVLEQWKDREGELIEHLREKYGDEPTPGEEVTDGPVSTKSYRDRAIALYEKYNSPKVHRVDAELARNVGNEESYIAALVSKYGSEPSEAATTIHVASSAVPADSRSFEEIVRAYYDKNKPGKPHLIQKALELYAGQEDVLLRSLEEKWGPPPPNSELPSTALASNTAESGSVGVSAADAAASDVPAGMNSHGDAPADSGIRQDTAGTNDEINALPTALPESPAAEVQLRRDDGHISPAAAVDLQPHAIFSHYSSSPPTVKQQLLLSFLNDREARLKDALDHNRTTASQIDHLQSSNTTLASEIEVARDLAKRRDQELEMEAHRGRQASEDKERMWQLEREQLEAQRRVDVVSAQRALNEARLMFEEERARKTEELAALRRRVAIADEDAGRIAQETRTLLDALHQRQTECGVLHDSLEAIKRECARRPCESRATQTSPADAAARVAGAATVHDVGQRPCKRCSQRAASHCVSCRVYLCRRCDAIIHAANQRFAGHVRTPLHSQTSALDHAPNRSVSHVSASDIEIDAEIHATLQEHEKARCALEQHQRQVSDMEQHIKFLSDEVDLLRTTGTAPSVARELAARDAARSANDAAAIQVLTTMNKELTEKVRGLELQLLAMPEPENVPAGDARELRAEVGDLQQQLTAARHTIREQKLEIRQLRGRLQLQLASPFGARTL
jgi:hypothetical protein